MATDPNKKYEEDEVAVEDEFYSDDAGNQARLVVFNDDFNQFSWVVTCFMQVLDHSDTQAEQLTLIIHFKGKATVKTGPKSVLIPKKDALVERGLSAVIEEDAA